MNRSATAERNQEAEAKDRCRHHWLIGEPAGATSAAHCKLCGERRDFSNVFEDVIREENRTTSLARH
jgi:hypothetical protein